MPRTSGAWLAHMRPTNQGLSVRVRVEDIFGKGPVCETGLTGRPRDGINTSHLPPWIGEPPSHESFLFFLAPLSVLGLGRGLHGKVV